MIKSKGVKNLSATSIRKIRRMIAAVLAEPEFYDQDTFGREACEADGEPVCGTVCCAAGWAVWLDDRAKYAKMMKRELTYGWNSINWTKPALEALDLTCETGDDEDEEKERLFGEASCWPSPFDGQYYDATTPKQRARVFAKRWEKFISSDGLV